MNQPPEPPGPRSSEATPSRLDAPPNGSELPTLQRTGFVALPQQLEQAAAAPHQPRLVAATARSFEPGQLVAGRFRIVRFIAQGAMGEVYEAQDTKLQERVALKSVRPDIVRQPQVLERFQREIRLARKVTHACVCRIYDVFETPDGTLFLAMELLEGETLSERLRRAGRLTEAEALPLVRQMGAALGAAHEAGVVHRDFKSGNVMLAPSKAGPLRAVVTDFGLARSSELDDGAQAAMLTGTGAMMGTPAYMAPEQVRGEEATSAADLYAFGVVLYEMVTGALPFLGKTPLQTAGKRLREAPASPRSHAPQLDPRWEAAILRCLEREPEARFASAAEIVEALEHKPASAMVQPPEVGMTGVTGPARRRVIRWASASAGVLALLLGAALGERLGLLRSVRQPSGPQAVSLAGGLAQPRRSIAVLGFKNLSGRAETAWISVALSELLAAELAAGGKLRLIPGENVGRMRVELQLPEAETYAQDTLSRIRENLGSDSVVLGSYLALGKEAGGKIQLVVHLQDTSSGEQLSSVSETGSEAELYNLVSHSGAELREKLGAGQRSDAEEQQVRSALPSNPEAAQLYAEGLSKQRVFDSRAARDLLDQAAALDPENPLIHSALAQAWSQLGYDLKAQEEAKRAFDLSGKLSREERLLVEGRYREMTRDWDKAIEIYKALHSFYPDNLDYGLGLVDAQIGADRRKEALATVETLRQLPPPASEDPQIDLAEANAAFALDRMHVAAARAVAKAQARGARLLLAAARKLEFEAWLGEDPEKAYAGFEGVRRIWAEAGHRSAEAQVVWLMGVARWQLSDFDGAQRLWEESLRLFRSTGNKLGEGMSLRMLGSRLRERGKLTEARSAIEQALLLLREVGNRFETAWALNQIGDVLHAQGDLAGAKPRYEEALALFQDLGVRENVAQVKLYLARVLRDQGQLVEARRLCQEALAEKEPPDWNLYVCGQALWAQGDVSGARKELGESIRRIEKGPTRSDAAWHRVVLARLELEENRPAEAQKLAQEALAQFQPMGGVTEEAVAYAVLARAHLGQGRSTEARQAIERAEALAKTIENVDVRLSVAIAAARVRAASGKPEDLAEAKKSLERALTEAAKAGFMALQFEVGLELGEVELRHGRAAEGRARLEALEKEASANGFGLIARKAAAAR